MWTYDELVATAYVFYNRCLTTATLIRLYLENKDKISSPKMDKLINKFLPNGDCRIQLVENCSLNDITDFINLDILECLIKRNNISCSSYFITILGMPDKELRDLLLEKCIYLMDFTNVNLRELDENKDSVKVKVKGE